MLKFRKKKLTDDDLCAIKIISNIKYGVSQDCIRKIVLALIIFKVKYGIEIYGDTTIHNQNIINVMIKSLH